MKTLKQISQMNPSNYTVIDSAIYRSQVKTWGDRIEIIYDGNKHKNVTRKGAAKYGLCERVN